MKKSIFLAVSLFLTAGALQLHAQSIRNTEWKTFIGGEVNDTITLHIHSDSSYATNSAGTIMVRSICLVSRDTLTLQDFDGPYACQNMAGKYQMRLTDTQLILVLINDPCEGRVQSINGIKWIKASK